MSSPMTCTDTRDASRTKEIKEWGKRKGFVPVKKHDSADEVEPQEHGQTKCDINGHPFRSDDAAVVGQFGRPQKVMFTRNGMDGTDEQLEADLAHPLPRHGDPPIVRAIVNQE